MLQSTLNVPSKRKQSLYTNQSPLSPIAAYSNHGAILLDVRTIHEFYRSKISGARHISYDMLPNLIEEIKSWEVPVITYSTHGGRSRLAAKLLERARIKAIDGGAKSELEQLLFDK